MSAHLLAESWGQSLFNTDKLDTIGHKPLGDSYIIRTNLSNSSNNEHFDNQSTLSTTGMAMSKIKPDKVLLKLSIINSEKKAETTLDANSQILNRVRTALIENGLNESQINTSLFTISPMYNYSNSTLATGNITGYIATNSLQIESSDLANVPKWIDASVETGANRLDSLSFVVSQENLLSITKSTLEQAISNAMDQANTAFSKLGMSPIGIKAISIESSFPPQLFTDQVNVMTTISPPEQIVSATVNIILAVR
jgi:uncharacterized protein YggE